MGAEGHAIACDSNVFMNWQAAAAGLTQCEPTHECT